MKAYVLFSSLSHSLSLSRLFSFLSLVSPFFDLKPIPLLSYCWWSNLMLFALGSRGKQSSFSLQIALSLFSIYIYSIVFIQTYDKSIYYRNLESTLDYWIHSMTTGQRNMSLYVSNCILYYFENGWWNLELSVMSWESSYKWREMTATK